MINVHVFFDTFVRKMLRKKRFFFVVTYHAKIQVEAMKKQMLNIKLSGVISCTKCC